MVLVEESVLSQVLASVPYQSPNPTNSSTYSYTSVTPGPDSYEEVSVHIWNRLPNVAIECESIDVFKKHLDSILADKFYSTIEDR